MLKNSFFFLGKGGKGKNWLSGKPPFTLLPLFLRVKVEKLNIKFLKMREIPLYLYKKIGYYAYTGKRRNSS